MGARNGVCRYSFLDTVIDLHKIALSLKLFAYFYQKLKFYFYYMSFAVSKLLYLDFPWVSFANQISRINRNLGPSR